MEEREFNRQYEKLHDTVYRIAFTYVKNTDDALDIVQDMMLRLYRYEGVFSDDTHCRQWVIRVTINRAKDLLRSSWLKKRQEADLSMIPAVSPEQRDILSALLDLPGKYRSVIVLHYFEGYSYAETAGLLKITEGAAKMRAKRGRELLKHIWTEGDETDESE
jgi:RNA polymerase sigma-70 factor (ECF subfamily)